MRVKHVTFNPMWAGLQMVLSNAEQDGWMLSHIVPSTQYEAVAVLVKPDPVKETEEEKSEVDYDPSGTSYL
jgi:hypothetical protein